MALRRAGISISFCLILAHAPWALVEGFFRSFGLMGGQQGGQIRPPRARLMGLPMLVMSWPSGQSLQILAFRAFNAPTAAWMRPSMPAAAGGGAGIAGTWANSLDSTPINVARVTL